MKTNHISLLFCLILIFSCESIFASIASVSFVLGKVERISNSGAVTKVTKKTRFDSSDKIITSKNGQIMLTMADKSKITIRPKSTFIIKDYSYKKNVKEDKSHYNLVKGGFRYVTGVMGKSKRSSYKLNTVVGTIGIRGTDFEATICDDNCKNQSGLFVNVVSGGISLTNKGKSLLVDSGQYGHIDSAESAPEKVRELPSAMIIESSPAQGVSKPTYATPEEQMVAIALRQSPSSKTKTINTDELVEAGFTAKSILGGATRIGLEPANVTNAIIESGVDSSKVIEESILQFPNHATKIITMGVATRSINIEQAKQIGSKRGVSQRNLKSAVTSGKLLRPPVVQKKESDNKENKRVDSPDKKQNDKMPVENKSQNQPTDKKRVNPQLIPKNENSGGSVPSPS